MRSGARRQGCVFLQHFSLNQLKLVLKLRVLAFFLHTLEMVKLPFFTELFLVKAGKRRGDSSKIGTRLYLHGQSQP